MADVRFSPGLVAPPRRVHGSDPPTHLSQTGRVGDQPPFDTVSAVVAPLVLTTLVRHSSSPRIGRERSVQIETPA